ncbi:MULTISPECIES: hypothetical protein [unclassified Paenibacillus]|uniref:hypothetical protein n=1 Tax=unclassified Paenibacillus TaxID=185978 RepID=UPI0023795726|nr:hypothetical protein [Paenibacillus sp. MAHUQ-63]
MEEQMLVKLELVRADPVLAGANLAGKSRTCPSVKRTWQERADPDPAEAAPPKGMRNWNFSCYFSEMTFPQTRQLENLLLIRPKVTKLAPCSIF